MPKYTFNLARVEDAFDRQGLADVCELDEELFGDAYNMQQVIIAERDPRHGDHFYFYKDNGSSVLAVAHLDTVVNPDQRAAKFFQTARDGEVVVSGALDDRLGAYTILELLPDLDITYDVLLTVGEESGSSTAEFFDMPEGKDYDWIIEFDRGGTDVVMYQYEDKSTIASVRATGAQVAPGIFSDISYMEHLGRKAFNWGVGYRDYHGPNGHAYLDDYFEMIARYLKFHQQNEGRQMLHEVSDQQDSWWGGYRGRSGRKSSSAWNWDEDDCYATTKGSHDDDDLMDGYVFDDERGWIKKVDPDVDWYYDDDGNPGYFDEDDIWHHADEPHFTEYREAVYFDADYIEDPTTEQIQAALAKMDEERFRFNTREDALMAREDAS